MAKDKWRVSATYFKEFKKAFIHYRNLFGLMQYRIDFLQEDIGDRYAEIRISESQKICEAVLNTHLYADIVKRDEGPVSHARHECIHLLLNRLSWLGKCRYVCDGDIEEEEEALTVILTRVIACL